MTKHRIAGERRTTTTELQDIAAMDRLAAKAAPASALRRYAASRGVGRVHRRLGARTRPRWRSSRA